MRMSFKLSPSLDFCNLLDPGEKIYRSQFYWFYAYKPGKCQKSVYISSPKWLHVTMSACKKIRNFFFWNFRIFGKFFFQFFEIWIWGCPLNCLQVWSKFAVFAVRCAVRCASLRSLDKFHSNLALVMIRLISEYFKNKYISDFLLSFFCG